MSCLFQFTVVCVCVCVIRYVRRVNEEQIERETIAKLEASEKAKILREKQLQQEAKLASQLQKIKLEEQRKERLRHLLKETRCERVHGSLSLWLL